VDAEGLLTLPLLGRVKGVGDDRGRPAAQLTTLLADGYLRNPQVTVTVKVAQGIRVFVTGLVAKPGAYPLTGDRTLMSLPGEPWRPRGRRGSRDHRYTPAGAGGPQVPREGEPRESPEAEPTPEPTPIRRSRACELRASG